MGGLTGSCNSGSSTYTGGHRQNTGNNLNRIRELPAADLIPQ